MVTEEFKEIYPKVKKLIDRTHIEKNIQIYSALESTFGILEEIEEVKNANEAFEKDNTNKKLLFELLLEFGDLVWYCCEYLYKTTEFSLTENSIINSFRIIEDNINIICKEINHSLKDLYNLLEKIKQNIINTAKSIYGIGGKPNFEYIVIKTIIIINKIVKKYNLKLKDIFKINKIKLDKRYEKSLCVFDKEDKKKLDLQLYDKVEIRLILERFELNE